MSHPSPSRREFLAAAAATAAVGPALANTRSPEPTADAVIWIHLVGGPSQLDTFDPKPLAPSRVRGPFRPIPTRVPGVQVSELFPKLAAMADKVSFVRGMHHTAAPIHETGLQLLNTGRLFRDGPAWPNAGAVVAHLLGERDRCPAWWHFTRGPIDTGVPVPVGQDCGHLAGDLSVCRPSVFAGTADDIEIAFDCAATTARDARFITVDMYSTVFDTPTWDCHAAGGSLATDLGDYRDTVAPAFDGAFTHLLAMLSDYGLLDRTLVIASGEFGRTPHLNGGGGRDHWPGCWTALVAGGGTAGGRVIGASDKFGGEPHDRPTTPQELLATAYHALGIAPTTLMPGPHGSAVPVIDAAPIRELF